MSDNRKSMAMGAGLGVVGMSAYYLPITKNRFVRNAFDVTKGIAEDKLEIPISYLSGKASANLTFAESKSLLWDKYSPPTYW